MKRRTLLTGAAGIGSIAALKAWDSGVLEGGATGDPKAGSADDATSSGGGSLDVATAPSRKDVEGTIADRINTARYDQGLPDLGRSSDLRLTAREHSRDMAKRDFYAHKNPDGEQPWHRAPCRAAETIHRGEVTTEMRNRGDEEGWDTTTADGMAGYVVEGWVLSKEHYQIMLDRDSERVGVGVHIDSGEFWATANYC